MDFAPVADVTSGPGDPTIGSRAAGSRPDVVAEHAVAAARGLLDAGIVPVVKHFPGHGSVPADSHQTLPVQTRSLRELREVDLVPFAAAVAAGLPAVMVGHLDVRAVDPRRALVAVAQGGRPACCATSSASRGSSSPTRCRWRLCGPHADPRLLSDR